MKIVAILFANINFLSTQHILANLHKAGKYFKPKLLLFARKDHFKFYVFFVQNTFAKIIAKGCELLIGPQSLVLELENGHFLFFALRSFFTEIGQNISFHFHFLLFNVKSKIANSKTVGSEMLTPKLYSFQQFKL